MRVLIDIKHPAEANFFGPLIKHLRSHGDTVLVTAHYKPLVASVLSRATCYVGNDSGVSHLAAACGAPTVAVFGPTDPAVWMPLGRKTTVVGTDARGDSFEPMQIDDVRMTDVLAAVESSLSIG